MVAIDVRTAHRAGALYFLGVFALGFLLGGVRLMLLVPWLGELVAVLVEVPVILLGCWVLCRRAIVQTGLSSRKPERLVMGATAFIYLLLAETVLAAVFFATSPSEYVASLLTPAGAAGLMGQLLFAAFPLIQDWNAS